MSSTEIMADVAQPVERATCIRRVEGSNPSVGSKLPFIRPTLPPPDEWLPFLAQSYAARYFSNGGPCVRQLEREIGERHQHQRAAVLTASATAGLVAILQAMEIRGPVVVPAFTFAATAQAVVAAGCRPVLCDVSEETWELDPRGLALALGRLYMRDRPGAILHVRAFGMCRDLAPIEEVAHRYNVPLIVDSAAAFGGLLPDGRRAGCQGHAEVFSFHATKPFGIGEGGAVLTNEALASRVRTCINFGLVDGIPTMSGINGKMSEFHAAVGLAMLRRIDAQLAARANVATNYLVAGIETGGADGIGLPPWQTYPTLTSDPVRVIERAAARGVELRRYYQPALNRSARFACSNPLPVSDHLADHMVCLPVYADMATEEQDCVIDAVR